MSDVNALLRLLPGVDQLLAHPEIRDVAERFGHVMVRDAARRRLEELREALLAGELDAEVAGSEVATLPQHILADLEERARDPFHRVINATGVIIHTNLGRAPLSRRAAEACFRAARHSVALEYEIESGSRGSRSAPIGDLLEDLFPGHSGLMVNNNAGAVLLCLNTLASDREVIISRGELVEIGGSFRVPEILLRSGARLREVGTTNRTRTEDYRQALGPETGAILRVHRSNFHQVGFTESAPARELSDLAREAGVPLVVDQGSGNLHELGPFGIPDEPTVTSVLEEGADLVTFSGDKLLGGPQAGIVVGQRHLVQQLAANALARALRPDKLILTAMVETLRSHQQGKAFQEIPCLRRLATPLDEVRVRVGLLLERLLAAGVDMERLEAMPGASRTGGGSSPSGEIPTVLLAVKPDRKGEEALAGRLRRGSPVVVGRVSEGRLLLDLRTVEPEEDELLADAVAVALNGEPPA
jgi:L-seryl-tRNA(Ser) seleniumtransferase